MNNNMKSLTVNSSGANHNMMPPLDVVETVPLHHHHRTITRDVEDGGVSQSAFRAVLPRTKMARLVAGLLGVGLLVVAVVLSHHSNRRISSSSLRHPLSFPKRRLDDNNIRYLTLGGPSTWGEGLGGNAEVTAYPYLLSPHVHNGGQRFGGPTLASLCTESIVGDEDAYDVVVLEFTAELNSLQLLAQRLRQRFPVAQLVFVSLEAFASSFDDAKYESIVESVQGRLFRFPPNNTSGDSRYWIQVTDVVNEGPLHFVLSSEGHQAVAMGIKSLVDESPTILQHPHRNNLGTWGSGDKCQLWYETGMAPRSKGLTLARFSEAQDRYALEVPLEGGRLKVENPFSEPRMVYLTYMTTASTAAANKVYPKSKVQFNERDDSVILDPYHDDNTEMRHVTRTTAIGKIPPGSSVLFVQPMEEYTLAPFRIVGVSLLASAEKAAYHISSELLLSPEPARVGSMYKDLDVW